jgi:hypothetical protein
MVEYGNGISHGGAGQVSGVGGSGSVVGNGGLDVGTSIGQWVSSTVSTVSAMPPLELLAIAAAFVVGLILLRRAF